MNPIAQIALAQATRGYSMPTLQDDFEKELLSHPERVLVVIGAGVSIATTGGSDAASWLGLLRNGVNYCETHIAGLPNDWANRMRAQLKDGDLTEVISVAEDVSSRLGFPTGGEYARWLSETVGSLQLASPKLLETISAWDVQIATTNYDDLVEKVTQKNAITWMERGIAIQFFRREVADVLHLHGYWRKPSSVILGVRSYDRLLNDECYQTLLQGLLMGRTIVFVGFGAGMQDPNFASLLDWSQRVLRDSTHRHYRLACRKEIADFQRQHPPGSRIAMLEYGETHADLIPFLEAVTERVRQKRAPGAEAKELLSAQNDFDRRRSELEAQKESLGAERYFRTLFDIARELWQKGGKRTAWMMIAGTYDREASTLTTEHRLQYGMELVQMMLDDDAADSAGPILYTLTRDAEMAFVREDLKLRFWQLQARGFGDLCAYDQALQAIDRALSSNLDQNNRSRLIAERAEIRMLQGDDDESLESQGDGRIM
jgi:hypothetical protein